MINRRQNDESLLQAYAEAMPTLSRDGSQIIEKEA
jgi:hypothetical protein